MKREVPRYAEAEDDCRDAAELLGAAAPGTVDDKLRLLGVALLSRGVDAAAAAALAAAAAPGEGQDAARLSRGVAALEALAKRRAGSTETTPAPESGGQEEVGFASVLATAQAGAKTVAATAVAGAARLLSKGAAVRAPIVLANLFEARPGTEHDRWLELDAKVGPSFYANAGAAAPKLAAADVPLDAVVFSVGAGSRVRRADFFLEKRGATPRPRQP